MGNYLLFQLYGQMAAWGGTAVGEERPTTKTPGKSSLAGLLGAALGIRREEHDRLAPLWEHYYMAVREDREGLLLIDYHTVQDPNLSARERLPFTRREALAHSKVNTVVTLREYLMEGAWMVCWWPSVAAPAYETGGLGGSSAAAQADALSRAEELLPGVADGSACSRIVGLVRGIESGAIGGSRPISARADAG